jgi:hypothetical protein
MTGPTIILRDGAALPGEVHPTADDAWTRLLRLQPMSVDWATTHEGYGFLTVDVDPGPRLVGRLADGARVYVEIRVTPTDHPMRSITHEEVTAGWRLSIMGGVVRRRRDYDECGQILDTLADVVTFADGWTADDVASLRDVWQSWHLNDMNAACAHMDRDELVREDDGYGGQRIACGSVNTCPDPSGEGYTYGRSWLYAPIPADVWAEVARLGSLPAGDHPAWMDV